MKTADYLRDIVEYIEKSKKFFDFAFVKKSLIEENIDKIYALLPVEVQEKRVHDKNFEINSGVYDSLKNFEIILEDSLICGEYLFLNLKKAEQIIKQLADILPDYNN